MSAKTTSMLICWLWPIWFLVEPKYRRQKKKLLQKKSVLQREASTWWRNSKLNEKMIQLCGIEMKIANEKNKNNNSNNIV